MVDIYIDSDTFNQAQADMFSTGAQRQVADTWATQASTAAPSLVADASDRANQAAAQQRQQTADDWAQQAQATAATALQSQQGGDGSTQTAPSDSPPTPAASSVAPSSPVTAPLSDPSSSQQPIQPPAQTAQTAQTPTPAVPSAPPAPAAPVTAPLPADPASPQQPVSVAPATQTTVGLSGGVSDARLTPQAAQTLSLIDSTAQQYGLGADGAKAAQAVGLTEGALVPRADRGDVGDYGNSFGIFQLYRGGQLANFAADMGMTADAAGEYARAHPDVVAQWALSPSGTNGWSHNGYLGQAIRAGQQAGLQGADLATYAQQHGQVSVSPERAGANYNTLFAPGSTSAVSVAGSNSAAPPTGAGLAPGQTLDRPSQFGLGLSDAEAYAACGPAAAIAFARMFGRNPTAQEAISLAKQVGWTQDQGMAGPQSEVELLKGMGVASHFESGVDLSKVAQDANDGNPVIISTSGKNGGHYFTVDGYDPNQGFHVGTSGTDLKGGAEWMTLDQMQARMGKAQGTIYLDAQPNGTSVASQQPQGPGQVAASVADAAGQKAHDLASFLLQLGHDPTDSQLSGFLSSAGNAAHDFALHGPIGAFNDNLRGLGSDIANSGAAQLKAQYFPSILDPNHPINVAADLQSKYGTFVPSDAMTPEDQQRAQNAQLAFGGLEAPSGGEGATQGMAPLTGNINLSKYPAEVQDVIQAAASTVPESATRGVVPDAVVRDLAQMAGTSIGQIVDQWRPGQAHNAETIYALRDALANQGKDVLQAQSALRATPDSADAQAQLIEALTQHRAIQEVVQGATAEAGRALRQFTQPVEGSIAALQQLQTLAQRTGQPVDQLARDLAGMDLSDPSQLAQVARALNPPRLPPTLEGSAGPQTGQLHLFEQSTPVEQRMEPGSAGAFETPSTEADSLPSPDRVRMAIEQRQGLGANPNAIDTGPTSRLSEPTLPGFPNPNPPSMLDIFRAYHSGNVISGIPTLTHVAVNSILAPAWSFTTRGAADVAGGAAGLATGGRVGLDTGFSRVQGSGVGLAAGLSRAGEDFAGSIASHFANPDLVGNRLGGAGGALLNAQSSFGALHGAFQDMAQGVIQRVELGRLAGQEATAQGLKGADWTSFVADAINNPGGNMLQQAQAVAKRAALRGDLGTLGSAMKSIAEVPFLGNTLFPVVRIASNSLAQGVEKSPLGLLGTGFDLARAAAGKGPYATEAGYAGNGIVSPLAERLTNNIAGSALTAWMASKALDGTVTGAGPSDPGQRALLEAQGWQPNSLYIPGRGYVDYHVLGALAVPLALAGAYGDAVKYNKAQDAQGTATALAGQVGQYLSNATGLRTIGELYTTLSGGADAGRTAAQFGGSLIGGFVPESAALRSVVSATDPSMRQAESGNLQQVIQQGLPGGTPLIGGRQDLPVKQDILGRPESNPQAGLGIFSPRTGAGAPSAAAQVLGSAGVTLAAPPKNLTVAGHSVPLTPDEQHLYEQARGQVLEQIAPLLLDNASFQAAPSDAKVQVLHQQITRADEIATQRTLAAIGGTSITSRLASQQAQPVARPNLALPTAVPARSGVAAAAPNTRDQLETLRQQLIQTDPQFATSTPDQQDQVLQQMLSARR